MKSLRIGDFVRVRDQGLMWIETNPWDRDNPGTLRMKDGNDNRVIMWENPFEVALVVDRRIPINSSASMPDRKSTRLNSSHVSESRMPSSA